jgi:hypothetical protein
MWDWYNRFQERQAALARGVDADLLRTNATRSRLGWKLLGVGALLFLLVSRLHLSSTTNSVFTYLVGGLILAGIIVLKWTLIERRYIREPDPKPPLTLFPK